MRSTRIVTILGLLLLASALYAPNVAGQDLVLDGFYENGDAAAAGKPVPYVEPQEKEFKFYPGGKVGISVEVPGNVKIIGWDRGSIRVEAKKIVSGLDADAAREFLKKPPVRIRYTDTAATIAVGGAPPSPATLEVDLTVYVPKMRTDVTVGMKRGDFSIDTVNGWVEATLAEGNMDVVNPDGYFSGKTLKGNIRADLWGSQWRGHSLTATTQSGRVQLLLPEKYSAALQLDTRNGEITVDYPPQEVDGELQPPEVVIQKNVQQLKATIGDGGAPLRLGTQSGDVSLVKK